FDFEGTLKINSTNAIQKIRIYALEDTTNPVCNITYENKKEVSIPLNIGNYQINGYTTQGYLSTLTFQVRSNKTVIIVYDINNIGEIMNN
ncbi:MAG: hypothetical protein ACK5HT_20550, partial [Draconibacterium sp.]